MSVQATLLTTQVSDRRIRKRLQAAGSFKLVRGLDLVLLELCCSHKWSWPSANADESVIEGYDSHQNCSKCATERLFNSKSWNAGPMYRPVPTGNRRIRPRNWRRAA